MQVDTTFIWYGWTRHTLRSYCMRENSRLKRGRGDQRPRRLKKPGMFHTLLLLWRHHLMNMSEFTYALKKVNAIQKVSLALKMHINYIHHIIPFKWKSLMCGKNLHLHLVVTAFTRAVLFYSKGFTQVEPGNSQRRRSLQRSRFNDQCGFQAN